MAKKVFRYGVCYYILTKSSGKSTRKHGAKVLYGIKSKAHGERRAKGWIAQQNARLKKIGSKNKKYVLFSHRLLDGIYKATLWV